MKNKEFEKTVVVVCLITVSLVIGLSLIFNKNKAKENVENEQNISLLL